jgi:hypothetical protein
MGPAHLEQMDREIQRFLYRFLPQLLNDIDENLEDGFSDLQIRELSRYFQQITTLCAVLYPHRYFLFFGTLTHLRVRKLHRLFRQWCFECAAKPSNGVQKKFADTVNALLRKMQDATARLSRNYQVVSELSLTKQQQKLLITINSSLNDTIKGLSKIGLESIKKFAESNTFLS